MTLDMLLSFSTHYRLNLVCRQIKSSGKRLHFPLLYECEAATVLSGETQRRAFILRERENEYK